MSDAEIEQLIVLGKKYKTIDKLWHDEFSGNRETEGSTVYVGSRPEKKDTGDEFNSNTWYTGTTVRVLTDSWRIASGALQAVHELRSFSLANARAIAYGDLTITVASADEGSGQNATRNVHAVLELDGVTLQPASKNESNITLSTWVGFGTRKNSTMNAEFTFTLPNPHPPTVRLILIGNNNKQHSQIIDFSGLR
jgi:hypothetical protein